MSEIVSLTATDARALTDRIKVGVEAIWDLITQAYVERAWDVLGYSSWDDYCTREFGTSRLRLPREERSEVVASLRESGLSERAIASATGLGKGTIHRELTGGPNGAPAPVTDPAPPVADSRFITDDQLAELGNNPNAVHPATGECVHCHKSMPLTELYEGGEGYECDPCVQPDEAEPEPVAPKPITGIDGKTYQPKPAAPKESRRKPLEAGFFDATMRLNKAVTSLENLGKDDRLPRNKDQVARYRNDLIRAIDALQRVANQLT